MPTVRFLRDWRSFDKGDVVSTLTAGVADVAVGLRYAEYVTKEELEARRTADAALASDNTKVNMNNNVTNNMNTSTGPTVLTRDVPGPRDQRRTPLSQFAYSADLPNEVKNVTEVDEIEKKGDDNGNN